MMNTQQIVINTSLTTLLITHSQTQLIQIEFADSQLKSSKSLPSLIDNTVQQIEYYFSDPTHVFDLPLSNASTPFQHKVRHALQIIPVGSTLTYQQLAQQLNTSPRAIGNACRANAFPIIIPCHRIVATNGLGGFAGKVAGEMLELKMQLLTLEKMSRHCA